jgi:hypothetical protein
MRTKYVGITALVMALVLVSGSLWWEICGAHRPDGFSGSVLIAPLDDLPVPNATELAQMDRLERNLPMLASPPSRKRAEVDLSTLGYVPVIASTRRDATGGTAAINVDGYRVSLTFDGSYKRFCVIDRHLYAEGAVLPDGAAIVKIESRRVLIARNNMQRWLRVEPLFDPSGSKES